VEPFDIVENDAVVQMTGCRLAAAAIQHDTLFNFVSQVQRRIALLDKW
jgi:hypothetical protein